MAQQVKVMDESAANIFLSPLYEKLFKREAITFNTLYPNQSRSIQAAPSTCPDQLTFIIPNQGMMSVMDSYFTMKIKVNIGNTLINDTLV